MTKPQRRSRSRKKDQHRRPINGVLLLDKPLGMSSNAALQEVKNLYYARKAGHTGSLDPLATGLLPICFGEATKLSQYLLEADKTYEVRAKLGVRTTTSDAEGDVVETHAVPSLTMEQIDRAMDAFRGEIEQVPSMYSALKHQGQPLYKLARQGITVERPARKIHVYEIHLARYADEEITFSMRCSKGTYVRTIVDDLGQALGCGAHVTALRRTTVGHFDAANMVTLDLLKHFKEKQQFEEMDALLLDSQVIIEQWPLVEVSSSSAFYLKQGNPVMVAHAPTSGMVRFTLQDGTFIGVGEVLDNGMIAPRRIFQ